MFDRDHPGTAERNVIEAFAEAVVALDDSVPTGTYVDMCSRLPVVDPDKITVPTLIMRGQYDGIAAIDDLIEFFAKLPNPDKQFTVMPGISHASFQQKNYMMVYHILLELLLAAGAGLSGLAEPAATSSRTATQTACAASRGWHRTCQPSLRSSEDWRERRDSNPRPPA